MAYKKTRTENRLTEKELRFVDAYLGDCDRNAYRAAIAANYKAPNEVALRKLASRIVTKCHIQAEIQRRFEQHGIGKAEVVALLARQARATIMDFIRVDEHTGQPVLDLRKAKKELKGGLIRKLKPIANREGKTITAAVEMVDSLKALALLARIQGYIIEKPSGDQGVDGDLPPVCSPESKEAVRSYLESIGESGPEEPAPSEFL